MCFCAVVMTGVSYGTPADARSNERFSINRDRALFLPNIQHEAKRREEFMGQNPEMPVEPMFKQVRFLKLDPPKTLMERIDRLIHGIRIDIPPEYDHYGYEIRRYMKSILNPEDLNDSMMVPERLKQARTARVILEYWKKHLGDEMKLIDAELEKGNISPSVITTYKYNAGVVNTFIPEVYVWIDRNIEFLEFVQEIGGEYYVSYPFYEVTNPTFRERFLTLYNRREDGLKKVIQYSPFLPMVY